MTWGVPNAGKLVMNARNLQSPFWSAKPDPATGKKVAQLGKTAKHGRTAGDLPRRWR